MASYTALSDAASFTGATFGVKLPTGDTRYRHFDWDVSIGSGSTDALLGAFHTGALSGDGSFVWYGQVLWDKPVITRTVYKPGSEVDGALGVFYSGLTAGSMQITPMLQALLATRVRDGGSEADRANTGYTHVLLSPAIEFSWSSWSVYADVQIPAYQYVNGNQLVAPQQFNLVLRYTLP